MVGEQQTELLERIGSIGDRPEDPPELRLKHRLVVYMALLMSLGAVVWGLLAAVFALYWAAAIPAFYIVVTSLNLLRFQRTKDFGTARTVQVFFSMALPFLFQWALGGFEASGAVMLWALVALLGALTFSTPRTVIGWVGLFLMFTVASGVNDVLGTPVVQPPSRTWRTLFFTLNLSTISAIVVGLSVWLTVQRMAAAASLEKARDRVTALNQSLEHQVLERTEELASSLAQSQAVLGHLTDGLVSVDRNNVIQVSNPAIARLLGQYVRVGQPAEEALGRRLAAIAERSHAQVAVVREELDLSSDKSVAVVASPILIERGDPASCVGAVVIVRDVTLERQIDRMKTNFIATVSHELRTPLTSILGFAKTTHSRLRRRLFPLVRADDPKAVRARDQVDGNLGIIVSEGERLAALISDLLDISKMESGQMEWDFHPIAPKPLVERVVASASALFPGSGAVRLDVDLSDELPPIRADDRRLHQVLLNLLSNARKFTDVGEVRLVVETVEEAGRDGVRFAVVDSGIGIDPADHAAVFERFKQVGDTLTDRPQGTGLGLPICKEIVAAHGGKMGLKSRLGEGATFWFWIPRAQDDPAEAGA